MNKTILTYGLLSGAAASVLMTCTALYFRSGASYSDGEMFGYAGILLSMLFVFFGLRAYRDNKLPETTLGFGEAFKAAILITLISCVCYVVSWMIVYPTLMPDFMDKFVEQTLAQLRDSGASEDKIREEAAKMEYYKELYKNPLYRVGITFLEPLGIGVLSALVSALVLRRK